MRSAPSGSNGGMWPRPIPPSTPDAGAARAVPMASSRQVRIFHDFGPTTLTWRDHTWTVARDTMNQFIAYGENCLS